MITYIFLIFIAICAGMAISVYAFGTGGKRKRIFQDIYFSVEDADGIGVIYTKTGEYSAVLKVENPVQKYCANIDAYYEFTQLFTAIAQTLGEGYALHKQDIFVKKSFEGMNGEEREFLSSSYFRYFNGRPYTDSECYLTITQESKKSSLFSYDSKKWRDFLVKIRKVHDQLRDAGVQIKFLGKQEVSDYADRYFAMNFRDKVVSMTNFKVDDECISMGVNHCKDAITIMNYAKKCPKDKLCIGSPMYGTDLKMLEVPEEGKAVGAPIEPTAPSKEELTQEMIRAWEKEAVSGYAIDWVDGKPEMGEPFDNGGTGWHCGYDNAQRSAYMYNDDPDSEYYLWYISYENPLTLQAKLDLVESMNVAGMLVWECSQDTYDHQLINQMSDNLFK